MQPCLFEYQWCRCISVLPVIKTIFLPMAYSRMLLAATHTMSLLHADERNKIRICNRMWDNIVVGTIAIIITFILCLLISRFTLDKKSNVKKHVIGSIIERNALNARQGVIICSFTSKHQEVQTELINQGIPIENIIDMGRSFDLPGIKKCMFLATSFSAQNNLRAVLVLSPNITHVCPGAVSTISRVASHKSKHLWSFCANPTDCLLFPTSVIITELFNDGDTLASLARSSLSAFSVWMKTYRHFMNIFLTDMNDICYI